MIRKVLLLLVCLGAAKSAQAQAHPAGTGPGAYTTVGIAGALYQSDYGKEHLYGPEVYINAQPHRHWGLIAEARFLRHSTGNNTGMHQDTYTIGPRVAFKPSHWVPYVKFPVGLAHMKFPYGYATGNYFVMAPGGGVEYWFGQNIHVRVADVEYQMWPQFTFGTLHPYGVTTGVSFKVW